MSVLDIFLGIFLVIGTFRGYKQGFVMSIFSLLAIVLGIYGGFKLLGNAIVLLEQNVELSQGVLPFIAFALVFVIIVLVVSLIGKLIKESVSFTLLGSLDQALGGIMGLLKMAFLLSIGLWIIDEYAADLLVHVREESWLFPFVSSLAPTVTEFLGGWIPALQDIFPD